MIIVILKKLYKLDIVLQVLVFQIVQKTREVRRLARIMVKYLLTVISDETVNRKKVVSNIFLSIS